MKCCKNENDHSISLEPTPTELKTWRFWHIAFLWVSDKKNFISHFFFILQIDFTLFFFFLFLHYSQTQKKTIIGWIGEYFLFIQSTNVYEIYYSLLDKSTRL